MSFENLSNLSDKEALILAVSSAIDAAAGNIPALRTEAEAKVPGTVMMGTVVSTALAKLTASGVIDMITGMKITAAIADEWLKAHEVEPGTLADTLDAVKYVDDGDTAEGARAEAAQ